MAHPPPLLPRITSQPALAWLRAAATCHAARIAVDDGATRLTYREIWQAACRLAALLGRVAPPDRPVALILPNAAQYPVAWIACLMQRRVAAFLDSDYPEERTRQCLAVARAGAVIAQRGDAAAHRLAGDLPCLAIEDAFADGPAPEPDIAEDSGPAFIIFTSGSTGRPKGIAIGAAAALNRAATLIDTLRTTPDDAILSMVPPSALGGMLNFFETFLAGATLLKLDLKRLSMNRLADRRITMLFATPALLRVIAQLDPDGHVRRHLRCLQPVGDALLRSDLGALRALLPADCLLLNTYGSTEALASLQWIVPEPYDRPGPKVATGYPNPGYHCTLVGPDGAPVPDGEPGELVLRSAHMSLGEWRDGALTPGPFQPDPASPGVFIHHTGDIALRHPDGLIAVLGRKDRQIKIRGNRIEPAEIEETLRGIPGVAQACVAARPQGVEPELVAFVMPAEDDTPALRRAVIAAARNRLPDHMVPARFVFVAEMPLLPGGKLDLARLLALPD